MLQNNESTIGCVGDHFYGSPEMKKVKRYSNKIDIWSSGLVVYYMISGGELPEMDGN